MVVQVNEPGKYVLGGGGGSVVIACGADVADAVAQGDHQGVVKQPTVGEYFSPINGGTHCLSSVVAAAVTAVTNCAVTKETSVMAVPIITASAPRVRASAAHSGVW